MNAKRVLIVSYHYPPEASIGGVRAKGLARYLPDHGWEPTVLTRSIGKPRDSFPEKLLESIDVDRAKLWKRRLGLSSELGLKDQIGASTVDGGWLARLKSEAVELAKLGLTFPDANRGWVTPACRRARDAGADVRPDLVFSTSPPVSAHAVGAALARHYGVPWIADLRDLWSQDPLTPSALRRFCDRRVELRTLSTARFLTTISEPMRNDLEKLHGTIPVRTILNGFDPESTPAPAALPDRFTVTYTGGFCQGMRDPRPFLSALARLCGAGEIDRRRVVVRFFSRAEPWLVGLVEQFGLGDVVELRGWVERAESLEHQAGSHLLLLLHWGGVQEAGVYTGKVFEYLGAKRPILLVGGGPGVLPDLLARTGAGEYAPDEPSVEERLLRWYREFETTGSVRFHGDPRELDHFSQERMAREFAELFDESIGAVRSGARAQVESGVR